MRATQTAIEQNAAWPVALKTGLDEAVEFHVPHPRAPHYFFPLNQQAEGTDLIMVVEDYVMGEAEYHVDLDKAVAGLLQTFAEQPPTSLEEKVAEIATLKALAGRLQTVATRLLREAGQREEEFEFLGQAEELALLQSTTRGLGSCA